MAVSATSLVALKYYSSTTLLCHSFPARFLSGARIFPFRFPKLNRIFTGRLSLTASSNPRPPSSSGSDLSFFSGLQVMFSKAEDGLRIFFAVLFWMSLFFWGSAWNGKEGDKPKGPRI